MGEFITFNDLELKEMVRKSIAWCGPLRLRTYKQYVHESGLLAYGAPYSAEDLKALHQDLLNHVGAYEAFIR